MTEELTSASSSDTECAQILYTTSVYHLTDICIDFIYYLSILTITLRSIARITVYTSMIV